MQFTWRGDQPINSLRDARSNQERNRSAATTNINLNNIQDEIPSARMNTTHSLRSPLSPYTVTSMDTGNTGLRQEPIEVISSDDDQRSLVNQQRPPSSHHDSKPFWRCFRSCPCNGTTRTIYIDSIFYNRNTYSDQVLQEDLVLNDMKIGGPGVIVEINESKFGKRKYPRGHRVEGVWVVGGVERTDQRKCFMVVVNRRDRDTLFSIITEYVLPGTIIHTDCWAAYDGVQDLPGFDYTLKQVNHSREFVTDEGIHTNTIEGTWSAVKEFVPRRNRNRRDMP